MASSGSGRTVTPPTETTLDDWLKHLPDAAGVFIGYEGRLWLGYYDGSMTLAIVGGLSLTVSQNDIRGALRFAMIDPKAVTGWGWEWVY